MSVTIAKSVGVQGSNLPPDVGIIQSLLNAAGATPRLAVDQRVGPRTIAAIQAYQAKFMKNPDGRIDPDGTTLKRLNGTAAPRAKQPVEKTEWTGDSSLWSQEKKLLSMNPEMAKKVKAVLKTLEKESFKPKIFFGWRSVKVQLELYKSGNTTVKFSFHNAQTKQGVPNAFAADIIDSRWAWSDAAQTNGFWTSLGAAAKKEGLYWGGDWKNFKDWAHVQLYPNSDLGKIKIASGL